MLDISFLFFVLPFYFIFWGRGFFVIGIQYLDELSIKKYMSSRPSCCFMLLIYQGYIELLIPNVRCTTIFFSNDRFKFRLFPALPGVPGKPNVLVTVFPNALRINWDKPTSADPIEVLFCFSLLQEEIYSGQITKPTVRMYL